MLETTLVAQVAFSPPVPCSDDAPTRPWRVAFAPELVRARRDDKRKERFEAVALVPEHALDPVKGLADLGFMAGAAVLVFASRVLVMIIEIAKLALH